MKTTTMVVPSYLDDWGLNAYEFRVYCRIARQAGKSGCLESIASMAQACLMDAKSVRKAIKRLLADKLIRAIAAPGNPTRYELNPMDEWEAAKREPLPDMVDPPCQIRHTPPTTLGSPTPTRSGIPPLPDPAYPPCQKSHLIRISQCHQDFPHFLEKIQEQEKSIFLGKEFRMGALPTTLNFWSL